MTVKDLILKLLDQDMNDQVVVACEYIDDERDLMTMRRKASTVETKFYGTQVEDSYSEVEIRG